jgi:hypothetical protein
MFTAPLVAVSHNTRRQMKVEHNKTAHQRGKSYALKSKTVEC